MGYISNCIHIITLLSVYMESTTARPGRSTVLPPSEMSGVPQSFLRDDQFRIHVVPAGKGLGSICLDFWRTPYPRPGGFARSTSPPLAPFPSRSEIGSGSILGRASDNVAGCVTVQH